MKIKFAAYLLLISATSASCVAQDISGEIIDKSYVVIPAGKEATFTRDLASIVKNHGMTANMGQGGSPQSNPLYVVEATNEAVRLWSQNVLLSGHEDSDLCGNYEKPHSDPGQFFISVFSNSHADESHRARELLLKVTEDLRVEGYVVRKEPLTCSPQSKSYFASSWPSTS